MRPLSVCHILWHRRHRRHAMVKWVLHIENRSLPSLLHVHVMQNFMCDPYCRLRPVCLMHPMHLKQLTHTQSLYIDQYVTMPLHDRTSHHTTWHDVTAHRRKYITWHDITWHGTSTLHDDTWQRIACVSRHWGRLVRICMLGKKEPCLASRSHQQEKLYGKTYSWGVVPKASKSSIFCCSTKASVGRMAKQEPQQ